MPITDTPALSRRHLFKAGGACALVAAWPSGDKPLVSTGDAPDSLRLTVAPARAPMVGEDYPPTAVWAYNGTIPVPCSGPAKARHSVLSLRTGLARTRPCIGTASVCPTPWTACPD